MNIAVTGATGQLGRLVIDELKAFEGSDNIVALVRNPEKATDLGVATRLADYDKPETLEAAFQGVERLLLISGTELGKRTDQHRAVIEAAKTAGVGHLVYTSLLQADTSTLSLAAEHRETEAMIKASGLSFTILRNGWYTENYAGSITGALHAGLLAGAAGEGRIASAARADYAAAAVAVLRGSGHRNKTYELAGDNAYTLSDLAAEISTQTGKSIPYQNMTPQDYAAVLVAAGLPTELADMLAGFDDETSKGVLFYDGTDLSRLIGRSTTPMSTTVAATLA